MENVNIIIQKISLGLRFSNTMYKYIVFFPEYATNIKIFFRNTHANIEIIFETYVQT